MSLGEHSKLCFCKVLWITSILWRIIMDILLFWCSVRIKGTNTLKLTKDNSKASFRNFVKADNGQLNIMKTRSLNSAQGFPFAPAAIQRLRYMYNWVFPHRNTKNGPGNKINEKQIRWEERISHQCWVMEPNPHILATVCTSFNHRGHKGSLRSTEHRHKVTWGPLLAGQLGEERQNKSQTEISRVNGGHM